MSSRHARRLHDRRCTAVPALWFWRSYSTYGLPGRQLPWPSQAIRLARLRAVCGSGAPSSSCSSQVAARHPSQPAASWRSCSRSAGDSLIDVAQRAARELLDPQHQHALLGKLLRLVQDSGPSGVELSQPWKARSASSCRRSSGMVRSSGTALRFDVSVDASDDFEFDDGRLRTRRQPTPDAGGTSDRPSTRPPAGRSGRRRREPIPPGRASSRSSF